MSRYESEYCRGSNSRLYRDRENGWIFGVCAGLSEWAGFRTGTVRIITIISLFLFFWPTVLIYAAATMLLRERPLIYTGRRGENDFWRCRRHGERWTHS